MCESVSPCAFRSIVNSMSKAIIIFRGDNLPNEVKKATCVMYNRAFLELSHHQSPELREKKTFIDYFPGLMKNGTLASKIMTLFLDDDDDAPLIRHKVEAITYEDKYIPKDIYTFIFSKIDDKQFTIGIESISHELKAKLLAEEIAVTKEQFVANVSHEIRTPLNGILGYISMLSDPKELSTLSDYQKNCFEQINDCSMNLLYIMNDILDFSKLNADQMQLKEVPFDISECLEQSYDVIKPGAEQKGLEVAFYIHPNVPPRVKGDYKKLRQILLNLISNGIKFTSKGRIDTTVKLIADAESQSELDSLGRYTIEFTVEDTGIGINSRDLPKLFKSFSQIDQSNNKIYQGTGLGLVISKKLVELMGGSIRVESVEGEGSKFIFTIKVEEARATSSGTTDALMPFLKDKNVLVVDDHVTNRITIASNLVQWGMKPFICGSAEEALLYLRAGTMHFDLALIDMRMPKMDGNELAEKIKVIAPNIPLIAVSSVVLTSATLSKNFSHGISKPIKLRQLFNVCIATVRKIDALSPISSPTESSNVHTGSGSVPPSPQFKRPSRPHSRKASTAAFDVSPTDGMRKPLKKQTPGTLDPEAVSPKIVFHSGHCRDTHRSILIAEDLKTNQRVIRAYLERMGFSDFMVVEDGKEALEAVNKRHYDIILMDLKMPIIDGFDATRRIRKFYQLNRKNEKQPFIVALTANAIGNIRDKCTMAGMDAYICKPINVDELIKILNESAASSTSQPATPTKKMSIFG